MNMLKIGWIRRIIKLQGFLEFLILGNKPSISTNLFSYTSSKNTSVFSDYGIFQKQSPGNNLPRFQENSGFARNPFPSPAECNSSLIIHIDVRIRKIITF